MTIAGAERLPDGDCLRATLPPAIGGDRQPIGDPPARRLGIELRGDEPTTDAGALVTRRLGARR